MAFIETPRFPDNISYGSVGGPKYSTTLVIVDSGWEYANINWNNARHEFNAAMGVRSSEEISDLIKFFHLCKGRAHQFRFKNWHDYKSCDVEDEITFTDQTLGIGNGSIKDFQLKKTYSLYGLADLKYEYEIKKPVPNTIVIGINGTPKAINVDYTVDYATGIVSFVTAPSSNAIITWGGEFDIPCRFDIDELQVSFDFYQHGSTNIPIIEVRI